MPHTVSLNEVKDLSDTDKGSIYTAEGFFAPLRYTQNDKDTCFIDTLYYV